MAVDFRIRHYEVNIANASPSVTLDEPVKIGSAFVQYNNTRYINSSYGDTSINSPLQVDDMSCYIRFTDRGDGFADTVQVTRLSTSISTLVKVNFSTIEYIGALGGPNEFINRTQRTVLAGTSSTVSESNLTGYGIVDKDKVVPICQGLLCNVTSEKLYNTGFTARITGTNLSPTLEVVRGGLDAGDSVLYTFSVVEFTGSNWSVYHGSVLMNNVVASSIMQLYLDSGGTSGSVMPDGLLKKNLFPIGYSRNNTSIANSTDQNGTTFVPQDSASGSEFNSGKWVYANGVPRDLLASTAFLHVLYNPEIEVTSFSGNTFSTVRSFVINMSSAGIELGDTEEAIATGFSTTNADTTSQYPVGSRQFRFQNTTFLEVFSTPSFGGATVISHVIYIAKFPAGAPVEAVVQNTLSAVATDLIGSTPERALVSNTLNAPVTFIQADKNPPIGVIQNTLEMTTTLIQVPLSTSPCDINKEAPLDSSDINLSNDAC